MHSDCEVLKLAIVADHPELNRCEKAFKEMYENEELVDVLIKTPDTAESATGSGLWAHKVVLSAVSPVLRRMLTGSFKESRGNEIFLQDVNAAIIRGFLDFVYVGKTQVGSLSELLELGKLADLLQVITLRDLVLECAREQLSATSCALLLQAGKDCGLSKVEEMALEYAVLNLDEVAATEAFLALEEDVVASVLQSESISCSEEALFEHALRWMTHGRPEQQTDTGGGRGGGGARGSGGGGDGFGGGLGGDGASRRDWVEEEDARGTERVLRGESLLRHVRFPVMGGQYLALHVHQRHSLLARSALLKELATEAALWQLVPDESKHLFQLRSLSPTVLRDRQGRWDVGRSEIRQVLRGQAEEVQCLKVWQNMLISGSVDSSIWVWNTQTWQCEHKLQRHEGAVCALEISDRLLFSGSVDCTICVWDMRSWDCVEVLQSHSKSVFCLKATKDCLLSGGDDCKIKVWQLPTVRDAQSPSSQRPGLDTSCLTLSDHTKAVCALEASGRRAFSGAFDQTIRWTLM